MLAKRHSLAINVDNFDLLGGINGLTLLSPFSMFLNAVILQQVIIASSKWAFWGQWEKMAVCALFHASVFLCAYLNPYALLERMWSTGKTHISYPSQVI